jgi:transglutaminase-like putative cysteine protease
MISRASSARRWRAQLARNALLCLLPATLVATGWRQLEAPPQGRDLAVVTVVAILVALLPSRRLQLAASAAALLVAVHLAFGLRPVGAAFSGVGNGVLDFYEVTLPFDPGDHERMHGVLVLAVFAFVLAASLAIARRRAILASGITFAGAAWPVTLMREAPTAARGALLLVAALVLLAALRPGGRTGAKQASLVGGAVVLAALIAVSSPAVAKGGFLDWERWEPYTRPEKPVSVSYVWNADYRGIRFPKRSTTVLTIKAPPQAPYWRATTLDVFVDDHWREDAFEIQPAPISGRDALVDDPLVPRGAWNARNWMSQEVTVRALRDSHLVGATMPIAYERGAANSYTPGVAHVGRLRRGQTYDVWSYVRRPTARDLARSRPDYPGEIDGGAFLETPSGFAAPFGAPDRERLMSALVARDVGDSRYERLYETAQRVVGRPRNPYAAVIALEAWFRSGGSFTYDQSPPATRGVPPLVAFVNGHRRGYCQHFAGAMALMLRYLGIPARVGAGFTTGRYNVDRGEYTVADTNAHTWVEVWFAGYGWLPFDPTPGQGRLLSPYTSSSTFFDASGATSALVGVGAALGLEALQSRVAEAERAEAGGERGVEGATRARDSAEEGSDGSGGSLVVLLLLITVGLIASMWVLKALRRRARYFTRDPRRLAGAVRLELVDYLVDQRIPVSASATPAEVGEEVDRSIGVMGERLAEALADARYGPASQAAAAATRARNELRIVRRAIRRRLGLGERLRGVLSLRSLGLGAS